MSGRVKNGNNKEQWLDLWEWVGFAKESVRCEYW